MFKTKCFKIAKTVFKCNFWITHPGISLMLYLFLENMFFMSEVVGYEEGDFHNGPETPRGLHQ